jgi:hypothetical protein
MNTQPELTAEQVAEMARDPELASAVEKMKEVAKKPPPKKKKEEGPTDDQIRVAVAGVVLAEFEMWPEELQALVGEDHPQKDSFIKGVPYVIGAYMQIARTSLKRGAQARVKEIELATARSMGPLSLEIKARRKEFLLSQQQSLADCNRQEQEEAAKAAAEISAKYQTRRTEIANAEEPEDLQDLRSDQRVFEENFDRIVAGIDRHVEMMTSMINDVDQLKDDWNSKRRKGRRRRHAESKKTGQAEKG